MANDDAPFEVEFMLGGGHVLPAKVYPDVLRESRNPRTKFAAMADGGSRQAAWGAAVDMVKQTLLKNQEQPLELGDDDTLWIVPIGTVMAGRLRDPNLKGGRKTGFSIRGLDDEPTQE